MTERAQIWRQGLDRARRAWRGSALPGFFAWWGSELVACLPRSWVAWWQRSTEWCLITPDDRGFVLRRMGAGGPPTHVDTAQAEAVLQSAVSEVMAEIDSLDVRVALCLNPHQVLRRMLFLPAAARGELARVLGYEIDRQTPFRNREVTYAARELGFTRDGRVRVELVVAPKAQLEPMLTQLKASAVQVDAVDALDGTCRLGVNLLGPGARPKHLLPRRRLNIALAALVVLLVASAMGQWLHNRRMTLATMQHQVDVLRGQAHQVVTLRQRLIERHGVAGFFGRQRLTSPTVVDVLADLTDRLPNDTWLDRLTIDASGRVGLQGESPHATQLLKQVAASPYLDNPGFQGVIQTDTRTGKERFYMTAKLHTAGTMSQPAAAASVVGVADAQTRGH